MLAGISAIGSAEASLALRIDDESAASDYARRRSTGQFCGRRKKSGLRNPTFSERYSRTYSYSTGRALMPRSGAAIQPAILPGVVTWRIRLFTYARSSGEGIHSY